MENQSQIIQKALDHAAQGPRIALDGPSRPKPHRVPQIKGTLPQALS